MRVHLVFDETVFFQPRFLDDIVDGLSGRDEIVGVSILQVPITKSLLHRCVFQNLFSVGFWSLLSLGLITIGCSVANVGFSLGLPLRPRSVEGVARQRRLRYQLTRNVMSSESLAWIRENEPDVILASCSQIFKKPLLDLPKLACINRHSGLLPAYGGVLPVFQALIHGEQQIGGTIHLMTEKIDGGALVAQGSVPVLPGDSIRSLYERSYVLCGELALEAFDKLREVPDKAAIASYDFGVPVVARESYFRAPTPEDWRTYRAMGIRFS